MPKEIKTITSSLTKGVVKGVIGGTIGATLAPIATFKHCLDNIYVVGRPTTLLAATIAGAVALGPSSAYGLGRGAQIASCDVEGIKEVPEELFNFNSNESSTLGSNFFTFFSKDAREKREEKRSLKRYNEIVIHDDDTEEEKIKKTIETIDHLRSKDEGRKHPRSLFSLFPNELIVNVAVAQRETLDIDDANEIAIQHFQSIKR